MAVIQTLGEAVSIDSMDSPLKRLILDLVLYASNDQLRRGSRVGNAFNAIVNVDLQIYSLVQSYGDRLCT